MYPGILPAMEAYRTILFCMDALPVASWRGIGKDSSTSAGNPGVVYGAWISFLQRSFQEKLGAVLSSRKVLGKLDRYFGYCK